MATYTLTEAVKVAATNSDAPIRWKIEAAIKQLAADQGAVYYSDVGPTGAWNVHGDCYDWAEANPTLTIEI